MKILVDKIQVDWKQIMNYMCKFNRDKTKDEETKQMIKELKDRYIKGINK